MNQLVFIGLQPVYVAVSYIYWPVGKLMCVGLLHAWAPPFARGSLHLPDSGVPCEARLQKHLSSRSQGVR